jgi:two-component system nitrogen regulation sensor histidine kinase NtrY
MNISELWESQNFRKRTVEVVVFLIATGLIIYLARVESYLKEATIGTTVGNRLLIFGITNLIVLLLILIIYLVIRTFARILMARRSGGGSKLKSKLVLAFVGLSFVPTILLFVVATGYINTSIVTWFNSQIEKSLSSSMEVAQETYRTSGVSALHFSRQIGSRIADRTLFTHEGRSRLNIMVKHLQHEYELSRVEVFSANGKLLTDGRAAVPGLVAFPAPTRDDLNEVMAGKELNRFYTVGAADLVRGIVPVREGGSIIGAVAVDYYVPESLAGKIHEIARSYQNYRQASTLKNPIRNEFFLTLSLITLVIMFLSVWMGIYLANSLTIPIKELADATAKVAGGDLEVHLGEQGDDEIGMLVSSFNKMTEDLRASQQTLRRTNAELTLSNRELEERRRYMEIVLENVTAGVVSLSHDGILTTVNKSAEELLDLRADEVIGKHFQQVAGPKNLELVAGMLDELGENPRETLRRQVTIPVNRNRVTLQVSMTALRNERGTPVGTVAVIDDMTQLMRAQRMAAWREVARRIAHEIKNPLTPIQLSAQRLRRRYLKRFSEGDGVFDQCTSLIIKSVEELKTLVNEFNNFARLPAARPLPGDLNVIIREAYTLYAEAHRGITLSFRPDPSLPQIPLDRDQIKRVLINLLDNAVAAVEGKGKVDISTSFNPELRLVTCEVADNGHGIAPEDRSRLFEPYFSTKDSGTGLGLAIVSTIITDHQGFVRVRDNEPSGTRFIIELPAG